MNIMPMLLADFYKISHKKLYDTESAILYSTWTPRKSRMNDVDKVIFFGLQGFIKKYLIEYFNDNFFSQPLDHVIQEYEKILKNTIGDCETDHIVKLHELGYLPIKIEALPEGTLTPVRVPMFTIENTIPEFYWVTNFLETLLSCEIWKPMTSATIALQYRKICEKYADLTCDDNAHVDFQCHDFSFRGMSSVDCACTSGAGHLIVFKGTDTIPAICYLQNYYNVNVAEELVTSSIPATEHSIMEFNSYGKENDEYEAFNRIITEVHPNGIVSIVSDTWNLWKVLTDTLPTLKEKILSRNGKVVIRPDSGDPCDIICGLNTKELNEEIESEYSEQISKGVIELLWDTFGGTINSKGYKVLDSHIGCIYGDAITLERAEEICERLKYKGFASSNIVFGVGSYTYNMNTRDTFGFALKTTYAKTDDKEMLLFKKPITDSGEKFSAKGKVAVVCKDNTLQLVDNLYEEDHKIIDNLLQPVFVDGKLLIEQSLPEIRQRIQYGLKLECKKGELTYASG